MRGCAGAPTAAATRRRCGRFAGWGFYVLGGKPVFHYNNCGVERYEATGKEPLAPGEHVIAFDFEYAGGGVGKGGKGVLTVDGMQVASVDFPRSIPFRMSLDETLDVGEDTGTPINDDYRLPFAFTGTLRKVVVELEGVEPVKPVEAGTGR